MAEDGSAMMRAFFEAMNAHDLERVAALASEDVSFLDVAANEEISGREAWREYCGRYLTGFPDMQLEATNIFGVGDAAVAEAVARGTHEGPLQTPAGDVPATSSKIDVRFCFVGRFRDGLLVDAREYYDGMTLMGQLGLMPQPEETAAS
jgi:steroid delta-isomerase-like uncharacterized protein